jgi:hypothetical protein
MDISNPLGRLSTKLIKDVFLAIGSIEQWSRITVI